MLPTIIGTSLSYTGNQVSKEGEQIDWIKSVKRISSAKAISVIAFIA